jgi:FkbH-like protein
MGPSGGQMLTRALVEAALADCDDAATWTAIVDTLFARSDPRFSRGAAEAIAESLEARMIEAGRTAALDDLHGWLTSFDAAAPPTALWVRARALAISGEFEEALAAWNRCLESLPEVEPEGLLHRARLHLRLGEGVAAAADVRLALQQPLDYVFWSRAEKVVTSLLRDFPQTAPRRVKIALLSGRASTALLGPLLRVACFRDGVAVMLHSGDYDRYRQDVLDTSSALYDFQPNLIVCHTHWRDAGAPAFSASPQADAATIVDQQATLWRQIRANTSATLIAHTLDLPLHDPYGGLAAQHAGGRVSVLRRANAQLREIAAQEGVVLIDLEQVAWEAGADAWEDAREWHVAKQHPASAGVVRLVEHQAAAIRAILGLSKKVLVLDLDNVLWGGVIGEDGLDHIQLGPPSATGEAFATFQRYILELKRRGVLLAVCSKNNNADARLPFEAHPETVLKLDDFVSFVANWHDKVLNLLQLRERLSLGLDAFVFMDDNPVERAWVRSQLPEVAIPVLPADPSRYVEVLHQGRYFESIVVSEEDRGRHDQYRSNVAREELRAASGTLENFLGQLQMVARFGPFDAGNLPRIAQLVNKTNQFNLTTRRYTEAQLAAQAADSAWWTCWFRLADRFGDHGLVGVLTCRPRNGETDALEIDLWLISCRVLGRTLEAFMLRQVIEHCRARNIARLYGRYLPTTKNQQVADLLSRFGFRPTGDGGNGQKYVLEIAEAELPPCAIDKCES